MPRSCMTERTSCSLSNYHPLTGLCSISWIMDLIEEQLRIKHITKNCLMEIIWVGNNNHFSRLGAVGNGYMSNIDIDIFLSSEYTLYRHKYVDNAFGFGMFFMLRVQVLCSHNGNYYTAVHIDTAIFYFFSLWRQYWEENVPIWTQPCPYTQTAA